MPVDRDESLRRRRLAAQRLVPEAAAVDAVDAARAVLGIQAQDLRAAGLAVRVRAADAVPSDLIGPELVRTWTVRGTAHLLAADDLPWIDALTGPRNRRRFDALMTKRSNLETAEAIRPVALELLAAGPLTRAELLELLDERGMPSLGPHSVNVLMPWLASTGEVIGAADGSFRRADPPAAVNPDEALATLGRRYLEGYGPAGPEDLARWSGLPITACRRALADVPGAEEAGEGLLGLAGAPEPEPPPARMLGAFDTSLLGWRDRNLFVDPDHSDRLLPGGGVIRAVVLASGRAAGTWRVEGSGRRRRVAFDWFGRRRPPASALAAEIEAVGDWLGLELEPAS
ncbi:MAG: winged helix DNA-binding domain-containing protein [Solirubrobacterales bacterium]